MDKSPFHNKGDSIILLSGDLTVKMKANTTKIVTKITIMTFLSEILFIGLNQLDNFLSGVVLS